MDEFDRAAHLRTSDLPSDSQVDYLVFVDDQILIRTGESGSLFHRRPPFADGNNRTVLLGKRGEIPVGSISLTGPELIESGLASTEHTRMTFRKAHIFWATAISSCSTTPRA